MQKSRPPPNLRRDRVGCWVLLVLRVSIGGVGCWCWVLVLGVSVGVGDGCWSWVLVLGVSVGVGVEF